MTFHSLLFFDNEAEARTVRNLLWEYDEADGETRRNLWLIATYPDETTVEPRSWFLGVYGNEPHDRIQGWYDGFRAGYEAGKKTHP